MGISIILTTHQAYLKFLDECIFSIEKQNVDKEIIIIADNVEIPEKYNKYRIINGKWGSPNFGRNIGIKISTNDWIVFFDGDDIMGDKYLEKALQIIQTCSPNVGVLYPSLKFFYDNEIDKIHNQINCPDWNYWQLRENNFIDTSAVWRKQTLIDIGGWDDYGLDDYCLALKLTSAGWAALPVRETANLKRQHRKIQGRFSETFYSDEYIKSLWKGRTFGILSLLAGRFEYLDMWAEIINNLEIPPKTSLYILDNSNNVEFSGRISRILNNENIRNRYRQIHYKRNNTSFDHKLQTHYYAPYMHNHVANLYNDIIPLINDDFILTIEDDIKPPLNGLKLLHDYVVCPTKIGAIGGIYPLYLGDNRATASINKSDWHFDIDINTTGASILDIGFIGGGFTLWSNFAIKKITPVYMEYGNNLLHGWDYNLCKDMRNLGYEIKLNTNVICEHLKTTKVD